VYVTTLSSLTGVSLRWSTFLLFLNEKKRRFYYSVEGGGWRGTRYEGVLLKLKIEGPTDTLLEEERERVLHQL
jgi:hypothetical protein